MLLRKSGLCLLMVVLLGYSCMLHAQQPADTSGVMLPDAEVKAYFSSKTLLQSTVSAGIIGTEIIRGQPALSLVPAFNTIAGVRMEERSPGSYRLSVRGSLLRSPFGVRNVKIYIGDLPFTDAGGNTYLNMLDINSASRVEIIKGPEASVFGANSGGAIIFSPFIKHTDTLFVQAGLHAGSYGLFREETSVQRSSGNYQFNIVQSFQRSDGYRQQSAFNRNYLHTSHLWSYHPKATVKFFALISDVAYETPGGLTLQQFNENPRSARPATAALPGATAQRTAVFNTTVFGGASHELRLSKQTKHVIALAGSQTSFENPFITNYESRNERTFSGRTYVSTDHPNSSTKWQWTTGGEIQYTASRVKNYGNRGGFKDTLQASDDVNALQYFLFTHLSVNLLPRLVVEGSLSVCDYRFSFRNNIISSSSFSRRDFDMQLMPRVGASYLFTDHTALRVSVSRGYSNPTIAEVRPSGNLIYTNLQAETGWNYETGIRVQYNERLRIDMVVFYYELEQAIVRRLDENGAEYFVNAGGTSQAGFEAQASSLLMAPRNSSFIRSLQWRGSFTYNRFYFSGYRDAVADYSGNRITGVPSYVTVQSIEAGLPLHLFLFVQYSFVSSVPLNDANSVYADAYHLLQAKLRWMGKIAGTSIEVYAGADNMLNEKYSLGNDLNAAGGRYYNAAPLLNYTAGIVARF